jgi:hypothetical protein
VAYDARRTRLSKYTFSYDNDFPDSASVSVSFDDKDAPGIENVLTAFEQFLLGLTFQPESIQKYLDVEAVQKALLENAKLVREFKDKQRK